MFQFSKMSRISSLFLIFRVFLGKYKEMFVFVGKVRSVIRKTVRVQLLNAANAFFATASL